MQGSALSPARRDSVRRRGGHHLARVYCSLIKPQKSARMAFGMPETNLSSHGNAENRGNLTFWHVVCQKLHCCGSLFIRYANARPIKASVSMADADIAVV